VSAVTTTTGEAVRAAAGTGLAPGARRSFWRRFRRHRVAVVGLVVLVFLGLCAVFAPWVAPYDPEQQNLRLVVNGRPASPSLERPFGTDQLGRDYLSRTIHGARVSLGVGFVAMAVAITLGASLGGIAGYFGGHLDMIIMRIIDVLLCFPPLLFLVALLASIPSAPPLVVMLAIGLVFWMNVARLVRAEMLSLREREFVQAARALGSPPLRILFRELLPNAISPLVVAASLGIPAAILLESTLSFLGFGVQPPTASWGNMLTPAVRYLREGAWWIGFFPGLMIFVTVLAFNFFGDGLRDALDPRSRLE